MVSNYISRIYIGFIIVSVLLISYLINLDIFFLSFLLILITYELISMKIVNNFLLIFSFFLSFLSFLFIPYQLFDKLFFFQLIFVIITFLSNNYKKELFILSLYIFILILFYIINIDRNLFYLLFLISFFNDTIAYISGRSLGGPLILPKISPNKTWSGTAVSFLLTVFFLLYLDFNILISIVVSILLFIGDIFFSFIKRFLSLKDFSNILGSHGGVLDRIDSTFFVAIIFQIYLVYLL